MKMLRITFGAILLLYSNVFSQKEDFNWYFGKFAGITFNTMNQYPESLIDSKMTTAYGSATFSDFDGKLLFYTAGYQVWNRKHELMNNDSNLHSYNPMVFPKPADINQYYVFYQLHHIQAGCFTHHPFHNVVNLKG